MQAERPFETSAAGWMQVVVKQKVSGLSVCKYLSFSVLSKNLKIMIYITIILPVVLYGCETWSLTLREERRLRVSENRVLRRIFGHNRDEVTGGVEKTT